MKYSLGHGVLKVKETRSLENKRWPHKNLKKDGKLTVKHSQIAGSIR